MFLTFCRTDHRWVTVTITLTCQCLLQFTSVSLCYEVLGYDTHLFQAKEIFLLYSTFLLAYQTSSYSFTPTRPRNLHFYNTVLCSRLKGTFILHTKQHAMFNILKLRACPINLCIWHRRFRRSLVIGSQSVVNAVKAVKSNIKTERRTAPSSDFAIYCVYWTYCTDVLPRAAELSERAELWEAQINKWW
jgi:hypothetical protein